MGNWAKKARKIHWICYFWERLASAKSCVWGQLATICRQGREGRLDTLGTPGRWGMVKVWLGRLGRVKVFGAIQGDQMSHLVLLFAWRRLASALVSCDPLGQLHIESFMLEGAYNALQWGEKGARKARVGM